MRFRDREILRVMKGIYASFRTEADEKHSLAAFSALIFKPGSENFSSKRIARLRLKIPCELFWFLSSFAAFVLCFRLEPDM